MCPFVVFIYANKFAWRSGTGDGNQGKTKHISMSRQRRYWSHARATHFSAGVQTMRARVCSAFSCAMFARVVWLKPRRASKLPTFSLLFASRACHAWLARLTRARRRWFGRRTARVLLADFCRAFGHSKAREMKSFFIFLFRTPSPFSPKNTFFI